MELRILGPVEVRVGGRLVELRGNKQRALLAILLVRANEVVSPDAIIEQLWGDEPPATATKTLQAHVSRLRATFEEAGAEAEGLSLQTHRHGYRLVVPPGILDASLFADALEQGRRELADGDPGTARATLARALDLWRGPALADLADEPFAQVEIARLEELRSEAIEERVEADLALGRHRQLIAELEPVVATDPLRERPRGQLMLALYRSGRQADALHVYQQGRRAFAEDLGVEPSLTLQALEQRILQQDPALDVAVPGIAERVLPTRWRTRWAALVAAVLVGVTIGTGLFWASQPANATSAGVAALDSTTGATAGTVSIGTSPSALAVGEDSVWVIDADDRTVSTVDPSTREVTRTFNTASTPTDIAIGQSGVWIGNAGTGASSGTPGSLLPTSVSRLDPETGVVVATVDLPSQSGQSLYGVIPGLSRRHIAVTPDAVWAINPDLTVSRIDPRTNRVVAVVEDIEARNIAAADGTVWITENEHLAEIDTDRNAVARRVELDGDTLSDIAIGAGSVWAAAPSDGHVWRVPTSSNADPTAIPTTAWVAGLAFGDGALWATSEIADSIHRIDPRTDEATLVGQVASPRAVDVGGGLAWVAVSTPPSAGAGLDVALCAPMRYDGPGEPDLLIVADLPFEGDAASRTVPLADAIRFVLERRGFESGGHTVAFQACDTATAQSGESDFFRCGSTAKAIARNLRVVGVIGPWESPCAFAQIPILNVAPSGPVAMVSPSNTGNFVTQESDLYPSGQRNYVRIAARESLQGNAQAKLVADLGGRSLAVLTSTAEEYDPEFVGRLVAQAEALHLRVTDQLAFGDGGIPPVEIARSLSRSAPDAVILVGIPDDTSRDLITAIRSDLDPDTIVVVPDAFSDAPSVVDLLGAAADGLYVTQYDVPDALLPVPGQRFLEEYRLARGDLATPDGTVAYGGQAAELLMDAIARSDGTRPSVTTELFRSDVADGILGSIAFDAVGDLIDAPHSVRRFEDGALVVDRVIVVAADDPGA
jgi:DNA-binding SARP family transcriptional activator/ABC-type branched-subunit amino acid transport system substrate-binding protein